MGNNDSLVLLGGLLLVFMFMGGGGGAVPAYGSGGGVQYIPQIRKQIVTEKEIVETLVTVKRPPKFHRTKRISIEAHIAKKPIRTAGRGAGKLIYEMR